jgi:hypothetical protein
MGFFLLCTNALRLTVLDALCSLFFWKERHGTRLPVGRDTVTILLGTDPRTRSAFGGPPAGVSRHARSLPAQPKIYTCLCIGLAGAPDCARGSCTNYLVPQYMKDSVDKE